MSTSRRASEKGSTSSSFESGLARVARSGSPAAALNDGSLAFSRVETFRVYRGRTGKFVLHVERSPDYTVVDEHGKPAGWRGYLGIGNVSYGSSPGESILEVVESLDELRDRIPPQLYDMVASSPTRPQVEDLDI
jgi:EXLDI family protein